MRRMLGLVVISILVLALLFSNVSAIECGDGVCDSDEYYCPDDCGWFWIHHESATSINYKGTAYQFTVEEVDCPDSIVKMKVTYGLETESFENLKINEQFTLGNGLKLQVNGIPCSKDVINIEVVSAACTDSDPENNIYVKGTAEDDKNTYDDVCTVSFWVEDRNWWEYKHPASCPANTNSNPYGDDNPTGSKEDRCEVTQGLCDADYGAITYTTPDFYCENGCEDGACLPEEDKCTDSDGGKDYYTKGELEAQFYYGGELSTFNYVERCFIDEGASGNRYVDSCTSDQQCFIDEVYCVPRRPSEVEIWDFDREYKCPNGCKDGACIPEEPKPPEEPIPPGEQAPMTPSNPYYQADTSYAGVACGKDYKCTGGGWFKGGSWIENDDCEVEYIDDYRCRSGDICTDPGPKSYCTATEKYFGLYASCGVGTSKIGTCKDATAPDIINIQKHIGVTEATITWETDEPAKSEIIELINRDDDITQTFTLPVEYRTAHTTSFSNLKSFTPYWFRIKAEDAAANSRIVSNGFQTLKDELPDLIVESAIVSLDAYEAIPVEKVTLEEIKTEGCEGKIYFFAKIKNIGKGDLNLDDQPISGVPMSICENVRPCSDAVSLDQGWICGINPEFSLASGKVLNDGYTYFCAKCYKELVPSTKTFVVAVDSGSHGSVVEESDETNNEYIFNVEITDKIELEEDKCTDTDPDVDYYKQGYITYGTTVVWDQCGLRHTDGIFTEKYQCKDESNCILFEVSCLPDNAPGGFASEDYKCPNGCKEGACIPEDEPLPNLIITDLEFNPTVPKQNQNVIVTATVKNTGGVSAVIPSGKKFIGLYFKGQYKGALISSTMSIAPETTKQFVFSSLPLTDSREGKYRVNAKVNWDKSIEESNYLDNTYSEELEFSRYGEEGCLPDLEIASFTMAPSYVLANEPFEIKVKADNKGCATKYQQKYDSATAWLFTGEQVRLPVGDKFRVVKLLNVGSATTNTPVIVDVDGITETVTGTETVNGVEITVKETFSDDDINKRSAILEIKLPNWKIASIHGDSIVSNWYTEPIVSYPETNVFGDAITKDEPIPTDGSRLVKKWMFPSTRIGRRTLNFTLDPDNIIKESDETNNKLIQSIYVFTKEIDCYEDFTLGSGEEAIVTGGRGGRVRVDGTDSTIFVQITKSYTNPNLGIESKQMTVGETENFLGGLYTVMFKSTDGNTATLQLTKCPMATKPSAPYSSITRTMFTGGAIADLATGITWLRFLFN